MKISTLEEYSIRCLGQLTRSSGKLTIAQIADAEGLTEENTAKVMARLRTHGLVRSIRGKDGGYLLARPADQITVAEVIDSVTGTLVEWERCHGNDPGDGCIHRNDCGLRPVWNNLGRLVDTFLRSITLADLIDDEKAVARRMREVRARIQGAGDGAAPMPLPNGVGTAGDAERQRSDHDEMPRDPA
jgi:Rrf2 family protein